MELGPLEKLRNREFAQQNHILPFLVSAVVNIALEEETHFLETYLT
jgi:hypothetical protein